MSWRGIFRKAGINIENNTFTFDKNKDMIVRLRSSLTTGSIRGIYNILTLEKASVDSQVEGIKSQVVVEDVTHGEWINAITGAINFSTSGASHGMAASICAEMIPPNSSLVYGSLYALDCNFGCGANASWGNAGPVAFIKFENWGAKGYFTANAFLFHLIGETGGSGDLLSANSRTLKVLIGSTTKYLYLSDTEDDLGAMVVDNIILSTAVAVPILISATVSDTGIEITGTCGHFGIDISGSQTEVGIGISGACGTFGLLISGNGSTAGIGITAAEAIGILISTTTPTIGISITAVCETAAILIGSSGVNAGNFKIWGQRAGSFLEYDAISNLCGRLNVVNSTVRTEQLQSLNEASCAFRMFKDESSAVSARAVIGECYLNALITISGSSYVEMNGINGQVILQDTSILGGTGVCISGVKGEIRGTGTQTTCDSIACVLAKYNNPVELGAGDSCLFKGWSHKGVVDYGLLLKASGDGSLKTGISIGTCAERAINILNSTGTVDLSVLMLDSTYTGASGFHHGGVFKLRFKPGTGTGDIDFRACQGICFIGNDGQADTGEGLFVGVFGQLHFYDTTIMDAGVHISCAMNAVISSGGTPVFTGGNLTVLHLQNNLTIDAKSGSGIRAFIYIDNDHAGGQDPSFGLKTAMMIHAGATPYFFDMPTEYNSGMVTLVGETDLKHSGTVYKIKCKMGAGGEHDVYLLASTAPDTHS